MTEIRKKGEGKHSLGDALRAARICAFVKQLRLESREWRVMGFRQNVHSFDGNRIGVLAMNICYNAIELYMYCLLS